MKESKHVSWFMNASFVTVLCTLILLPVFFTPYFPLALGVSKGFLLFIGPSLSLVFWLIARLVDGKFILPKSIVVLSGIGFLLVTFLSGIFSKALSTSFSGIGFDFGSVVSVSSLVLLVIVSALVFQSREKIYFLFGGIFVSSTFVLLFQVVRTIFPNHLRVGFFSSLSNTPTGSINDLAILAGFVVIFALLTLELVEVSKKTKLIVSLGGVLGLVSLVGIGFNLAWLVVGIFALFIFIYNLSIRRMAQEEDSHISFPVTSFVTVLVCLFFILGNNLVQSIPSQLGIQDSVIRPSLSSTFSITRSAFYHDPILGTGPNMFSVAWNLYKPADVALTDFSTTDFTLGVSSLATLAMQSGILGLLAILIFLGSILVLVVKFGFKTTHDQFTNYITFSSALFTLYFLVFALVYVPGIVISGILFACVGVYVGLLIYKRQIDLISWSFLKDPRTSFFSILISVACVIGTIALIYSGIQNYIGGIYLTKGIKQYTLGETDRAVPHVVRATRLHSNEAYFRTLSQLYTTKISKLLSQDSISQDSIKPELQALLSSAESSAQSAINSNRLNYANWMSLGSVYEFIIPFGVANAYENTVAAYTKAREFSPKNPSIYLRLAQTEIAHKNIAGAKENIGYALKLKVNYADAYILLSQISFSENKVGEGAENLEKAGLSSPFDSSIPYQIGMVSLNQKNYSRSVSAFERSVILNPRNMNARYMLAVAYTMVDRSSDALQQLTIIDRVLPNNEEVQKAIENVNSGRKLLTVTLEEPVVDTETDTDVTPSTDIPENQ
jgi:cytochrome c-type biogenesis protein CcmH/NrfG